MRFIGVSSTLILIEFMLLLMIIPISKDKAKSAFSIFWIMFVIVILKITSFSVFGIEYDNKYSTVSIIERAENTYININNSSSSKTNKENTVFYEYVNIINNFLKREQQKKILVIGAGGFTVGFNDTNNTYTYIDVDSDLKAVATTKFLKEELKGDKTFKAEEIRKFLVNENNKYDIIIVDAYTNRKSSPQSLLTVEFYEQLKEALNSGGYVISNMVSDMFLNDNFSQNIDNTMRAVFGSVVKIPLFDLKKNENYVEISKNKAFMTNNLYILRRAKQKNIYTDDKNKSSFDRE
jgi:spermidine synthase